MNTHAKVITLSGLVMLLSACAPNHRPYNSYPSNGGYYPNNSGSYYPNNGGYNSGYGNYPSYPSGGSYYPGYGNYQNHHHQGWGQGKPYNGYNSSNNYYQNNNNYYNNPKPYPSQPPPSYNGHQYGNYPPPRVDGHTDRRMWYGQSQGQGHNNRPPDRNGWEDRNERPQPVIEHHESRLNPPRTEDHRGGLFGQDVSQGSRPDTSDRYERPQPRPAPVVNRFEDRQDPPRIEDHRGQENHRPEPSVREVRIEPPQPRPQPPVQVERYSPPPPPPAPSRDVEPRQEARGVDNRNSDDQRHQQHPVRR